MCSSGPKSQQSASVSLFSSCCCLTWSLAWFILSWSTNLACGLSYHQSQDSQQTENELQSWKLLKLAKTSGSFRKVFLKSGSYFDSKILEFCLIRYSAPKQVLAFSEKTDECKPYMIQNTTIPATMLQGIQVALVFTSKLLLADLFLPFRQQVCLSRSKIPRDWRTFQNLT